MEQLQTRTEHSRSLEDADRLRAIHTLTEVGLLIPLTEIQTFHGRTKVPGEIEPWAVDPSFKNGGDDSGNYNVNERSTLYSGERAVAEEFAAQRSANAVRPLYMDTFRDKVRRYSDEEKRAWLRRLNQEKKQWWDSMKPEMRDLYHRGPGGHAPVLTLADLEKEQEIYREAQTIEQAAPENVRKFIWGRISRNHEAQVHDITSDDSDARIIDLNFDETKLSDEDSQAYEQALKVLVLDPTEGSPVGFDDRSQVAPFVQSVKHMRKKILTAEDIQVLAQKSGIKPETALHLGSAFNARRACILKPSYLVDLLLKNRTGIVNDAVTVNGESKVIPFNIDYVERYLREAHIVGARHAVISATLGRAVDSVSIFDLEKINTEPHYKSAKEQTLRKMGTLASQLDMPPAPESSRSQLLRILEDPHAKPETLVANAQSAEGYSDIFAARAGNWEGFTLASHTETVLRNFDENYADSLPVEMLASVRLMLLAHDLGKPKAAADHVKHKQKEFNLKQAQDFFSKLEIPQNRADFYLSIIGNGADLAYESEVLGRRAATINLRLQAVKSLQRLNGGSMATADQVDGYIELCRMLLVCDGGAYTSMATTRRPEQQGGRYRNAPSFNHSFARPHGFGKRSIKLAEKAEDRAPVDLTPQPDPDQSKLRITRRGVARRAPRFTTR